MPQISSPMPRGTQEMVVRCNGCGHAVDVSHAQATHQRSIHCGRPMAILHNN
jgi:ribosomal protein S27E